jgi:hypothetical protein
MLASGVEMRRMGKNEVCREVDAAHLPRAAFPSRLQIVVKMICMIERVLGEGSSESSGCRKSESHKRLSGQVLKITDKENQSG